MFSEKKFTMYSLSSFKYIPMIIKALNSCVVTQEQKKTPVLLRKTCPNHKARLSASVQLGIW